MRGDGKHISHKNKTPEKAARVSGAGSAVSKKTEHAGEKQVMDAAYREQIIDALKRLSDLYDRFLDS